MARHLDLLFSRTLPSETKEKREAYKAAVSLVAGLVFASTLLLAAGRPRFLRPMHAATSAGPAPLEIAPPLKRHIDLPPDDPTPSYALIPTGVSSAEDLRRAIENDSALEWHFADFNLEHAVLRVLVRDEPAYVSYRKEGQILWTKHTVMLHKGEFVLDDGARMVRSRCGNRIAIETEAPPILALLERPPEYEFPGPAPEVPGAPPPTTVYVPPPPPPPCCGIPVPLVPPIYVPPGGGGPSFPPGPPGPPTRVPEPPTIAIVAAAGGAALFVRKWRYLRASRRRTTLS